MAIADVTTMPRWKRALEVVVIAAVSLAFLYLAGANLFLAFGLRRIVSGATMTLDYRSGWTVWPGRVHLKAFRIQDQTDSVEWMLSVEEATVDLQLLALIRKEVHLQNVLAGGLKFRFRLGVMPDKASDPKNLALPPIPPFDDPPIRMASADSPEFLRGAYRYWVVRIDDSDAHVDEIWVNHYRFQGSARSRGGFSVAPHRAIAMGGATLDVYDGVLSLAGQDVARALGGRLTCAIDSFDPDDLRGRAMLRAFSSELKLDAQVASLGFLEFYVPPSRMSFEDGGGHLHAEASLRRGRLAPGSLLDVEAQRLRLLTPTFEILADASASARVADDETLSFRARIPETSVWRLGVKVPPLSITDVTASYGMADGDVAGGLGFAGLEVHAPHLAAPDMRWITKIQPSAPTHFDAGRVTASADLEVDAAMHARSQAKVAFQGVALALKDARVFADLVATASVVGDDVLAARTLAITSGGVTLSHGLVKRGGSDDHLTGHVDIERGELDFKEGFGLELASHAVVNGTDAVLDMLGAPGLAKTAGGIVGSDTAKASAQLAYRDGLFTLKILKGASGETRVKGEVRTLGAVTEAAVLVKADLLSLGIDVEDGRVHTAPEAGDHWLETHRPTLKPRPKRKPE